jgi:outer membrane protein assembly factor BamB
VIVALKTGQGGIATLNEQDGTKVDTPIVLLFPTEHAPASSGSTMILVTSIGRVIGVSFGGQMLFTAPTGTPLGVTSPIAIAPDGSIRIASTTGIVAGFSAQDGSSLFTGTVDGAVSTPLAVAPDGTIYAATDSGHLTGISSSGSKVFDATVKPPASGPSVSSMGRVAVGGGDGVQLFDSAGNMIFHHPRTARVVGTKITDSGEVVAWGEDGVVEILSMTGDVVAAYSAGPPIYANVIVLKNGKLAVFDSMGTGHLVNREGKEEARVALGGAPETEIAQGDIGYIFVTVGSLVHAFDFAPAY